LILTSTIKNTPIGYFGFEKFGAQIFGTQMSAVPLIVNAIPGDTVAILEQRKRRPQELGVAVTINGADATSNCFQFQAQKIDGAPGSALIKIAGITEARAPASGDTVAIDYRLTENGRDYLGEVFRGVVDGKPIVTKEPGEMAVYNVTCRDTSTLAVLQTAPVTTQWAGTAHDLARIELAAAGVVGILEFDDFDIYGGSPAGPANSETGLLPSSQFLTVGNLLLWMCAQTSIGNIYADASGAVHVASMSSARPVDHNYPVNGVVSITPAQTPAAMSYNSYSVKQRPYPGSRDGTAAEIAAKVIDYRNVSATLAAFLAGLSSITYHDVKVSENPDIVCGHNLSAVDELGATITGTVRSIVSEGRWPEGFSTVAQIAVLP